MPSFRDTMEQGQSAQTTRQGQTMSTIGKVAMMTASIASVGVGASIAGAGLEAGNIVKAEQGLSIAKAGSSGLGYAIGGNAGAVIGQLAGSKVGLAQYSQQLTDLKTTQASQIHAEQTNATYDKKRQLDRDRLQDNIDLAKAKAEIKKQSSVDPIDKARREADAKILRSRLSTPAKKVREIVGAENYARSVRDYGTQKDIQKKGVNNDET